MSPLEKAIVYKTLSYQCAVPRDGLYFLSQKQHDVWLTTYSEQIFTVSSFSRHNWIVINFFAVQNDFRCRC